jgi:hypothetical protein
MNAYITNLLSADVRTMDDPSLAAYRKTLQEKMLDATGLTLTRLRGKLAEVQARQRMLAGREAKRNIPRYHSDALGADVTVPED